MLSESLPTGATPEGEEEGEGKTYNKKTHKRCIKCRKWHDRQIYFGLHETSSDGRQSICKDCKKNRNKEKLAKNAVARLRHHTASRCLTQLGDAKPEGFTRNIEDYLGYRIKTLVRHLRQDLRTREGPTRKLIDALNEGYHVDHIRPLRLYKVILEDGTVDWDVFKECWAVTNLSAIPGQENLQKGGKYDGV